jgi:hypothetical protein
MRRRRERLRGQKALEWKRGELPVAKPKRHHVEFTAQKMVKEPTEVMFKTRAGKRVDFVAAKPVKEEVAVSFMARNKKK